MPPKFYHENDPLRKRCLKGFGFEGFSFFLLFHFEIILDLQKNSVGSSHIPFTQLLLILYLLNPEYRCLRLSWWLVGKGSACNAGDSILIPGLGRSPEEGNGNPLKYSCQENPMDREAWRATVPGITKNQT